MSEDRTPCPHDNTRSERTKENGQWMIVETCSDCGAEWKVAADSPEALMRVWQR